MDEGAYRIHGISNEFLKDKPQFSQISKEFLEFIGNHKLIIHNASFDKKFINNELAPLGLPLLEDNRIIDTLQIARRKFPGAQASLDALCKRFNLSLENRTKHGALIDAELLAMVYIMMHRNVQTFMDFSNNDLLMKDPNNKKTPDVPYYQYRKYDISEKELQKHQELLKNIKDPLWYKKAIV